MRKFKKQLFSSTSHRQGGFTLVELTFTITIFAILSTGLLVILMNFFTIIIRNSVMSEMTSSSQTFLRTTEEHIRYGAGVRQNNLISDPNAPVGGWTTSSSIFVIVIAVPAQDSNREYIIDPSTGSPYQNELIYYKSGKLLLQRTLANPSAIGNTLKTSCPPSIATLSCPADKELLNKLSSIAFTFYDQDNGVTTVAENARSVSIDLVSSVNSFGEPLTLSNTVRVTLRNLL